MNNLLGKVEEAPAEEATDTTEMHKYMCGPCGYIYDPAKGDPDSGIAPGTPFEMLPDNWRCPICGVSKDMFQIML